MNKLKNFISKINPFYFLAIALIFGIVSIVSLRHNNQHMVTLRDAVYAADKQDGDVEQALRNLRQYIYGHMNTALASGPNAVRPPIQLKYTYERLQQQQANILGTGNSQLYQDAQTYCDQQTKIDSEVIACIQQYATDHGADLQPIPAALYKFDFVSTKWSWDLAGWSIILTALAVLIFIKLTIYDWVYKKIK